MLEAILDDKPCETEADALREGILDDSRLVEDAAMLMLGAANDIGRAFLTGLVEDGGEVEDEAWDMLVLLGGDDKAPDELAPDWEEADERGALPFPCTFR